ncbi:DUF1631 family protein [Jeongeupia chitinilytica]|uniref:DUF1631 domain-containing protein n=1 Tax=Jeongeupia chitinilytica TaxID=1041641 RepID=A0ABQ3H187_9NEIS|nr:DUF1631 family protein [Jeongeupia chitinilytica]GHD60751.1 hypothetical protein GCM10007350_14270 [Jeongeupia chitinilytica]
MHTVRARTEASPQAGTLIACRDLALEMLTESLDDFFEELEETFFQLAETTTERGLRDQYFDARVEARTKKDAIVAAFKQQFLASFEASLQTRDPRNESSFYQVSLTPDALSLVANDEYEASLTLSSVTNAMQQKGGDTLTQLEQRLATLLPERSESTGPLSPKAICEAFLNACQQLESGLAARLVALRTFETELSGRVAGVYQQLNQYLIQQNVALPGLTRRTGSRGEPHTATSQAGSDSAYAPQGDFGARGGEGTGSAPVTPASLLRPELIAHLNQLFSAGAPSTRRPVRPDWFNFLDHLQQDSFGTSQDLFAQPENLLALLRGSRWTQELDRVDTMTVELVTLLFDRLFDDTRLPSAAKGLLSRLQVPALKAAMLDAGFFSDKSHPARRLIDRIAEASLEWQEEPSENDARLRKFAELIAEVAATFSDDAGVFQTALDSLNRWLEAESSAIDASISEQAEALLAGEISELAQATVQALLEQRLQPSHPPVVVAFISEQWHVALVAAYDASGESAPLFVERLAVVDDLLWSVAPKVRPEDRLQLVNTLPALLARLEKGMRDTGVADEVRKAFFAELVQLHASAIRQGLKLALTVTVETAPQVPAARTPVPATPIELDVIVPARPATPEIEYITDEPAPVEIGASHASEPETSTEPAVVADLLARGDWVEWYDGDAPPRRLRVGWVSPQGTRFLLTSRTDKGLTLMRNEVEAHLASGALVRIDLGAGVTEDAFSQLRDALTV